MAVLLAAYAGCTQDFDQFEPDSFTTSSGGAGPGPGSGASGPGPTSGPGSGGGSGGCETDAACNDMEPCTTDTCKASTGKCDHVAVADGPVSGAMDAPNDCTDPVCVAGNSSTKPDDTESADDGNDCTTDSCANGTKMNLPVAQGTPCAAGTCNGQGQCVGCNTPTDCGVDDFCKQYTCDAQICGITSTGAGTALPNNQQTNGDCQELQCDGNGASLSVTDNGDDPPPDGNQCTADVCDNGVPAHPPVDPGTSCGGGNVCDGAGNCVECVDAGDCSGNETCVGNVCVAKPCNSSGDCSSNHCSDGVCCNVDCSGTCKTCNLPSSLGICVNVPPPSPDPPNCTGSMACADGGICKKANGQPCGGSNECASNKCMGGTCQ